MFATGRRRPPLGPNRRACPSQQADHRNLQIPGPDLVRDVVREARADDDLPLPAAEMPGQAVPNRLGGLVDVVSMLVQRRSTHFHGLALVRSGHGACTDGGVAPCHGVGVGGSRGQRRRVSPVNTATPRQAQGKAASPGDPALRESRLMFNLIVFPMHMRDARQRRETVTPTLRTPGRPPRICETPHPHGGAHRHSDNMACPHRNIRGKASALKAACV